ncbi:hypothetical protein SAMN05878482_11269 [Peribacillus simplex]|uniref:Uncharacterized protein n=1 Tax=Peribacillus simplex TaxID=1478 RepID=A0A9X8WN78_9BACI|nr:hypothetical protein SAMN05878482_11269 [Peribacillus simplex]
MFLTVYLGGDFSMAKSSKEFMREDKRLKLDEG